MRLSGPAFCRLPPWATKFVVNHVLGFTTILDDQNQLRIYRAIRRRSIALRRAIYLKYSLTATFHSRQRACFLFMMESNSILGCFDVIGVLDDEKIASYLKQRSGSSDDDDDSDNDDVPVQDS